MDWQKVIDSLQTMADEREAACRSPLTDPRLKEANAVVGAVCQSLALALEAGLKPKEQG